MQFSARQGVPTSCVLFIPPVRLSAACVLPSRIVATVPTYSTYICSLPSNHNCTYSTSTTVCTVCSLPSRFCQARYAREKTFGNFLYYLRYYSTLHSHHPLNSQPTSLYIHMYYPLIDSISTIQNPESLSPLMFTHTQLQPSSTASPSYRSLPKLPHSPGGGNHCLHHRVLRRSLVGVLGV